MATSTNRIVWLTLVVAQLIYVGVGYNRPASLHTNDVVEPMFLILLVLSALMAYGTIVYRKRALVVPIQSGSLDLGTPEGQGRAFTPFILNLVLSQAVGVYGLVLTFLSSDPRFVVGFSATSLALMYVHRPTAPELQAPSPLGPGRGTPVG